MSKKKYIIDGFNASVEDSESEILENVKRKISMSGIKRDAYDICLYKKSVDARKKDNIKLVCSFAVTPKGNKPLRFSTSCGLKVRELDSEDFSLGEIQPRGKYPPLVVGMGPCGLFCALLLAECGYEPIIIDRGDDVKSRVSAIEGFYRSGILDGESNIQFGAGGAGTFSDGKLVTRINDPLVNYVLMRLHEFGAPDEILTKAKPHIGTDLLRGVVDNILKRISDLGGKVIYRCRFDSLVEDGECMTAITSLGEIKCSSLVLALGHSARDTYKKLLDMGFSVVPKPFSVGVRIEHRREDIEYALHGSLAGHKSLGAAEYALSDTTTDRGVYTFCMCPGGEVMAAASEEGGVVVNGMSHYARDGRNSNAAVAVSVKLEDVEPYDGSAVLGAIEFQRKIERAAFSCGGKNYGAPIQTVGDFLEGKEGSEPTLITPTYMNGERVKLSNMDRVLPSFVTARLREGLLSFDKKIKGYARPEAILTGAETRTSSPLRILRGEDMVAIGKKNIYPCGEGAGYAGGITSAAVDGIKVARAILTKKQ